MQLPTPLLALAASLPLTLAGYSNYYGGSDYGSGSGSGSDYGTPAKSSAVVAAAPAAASAASNTASTEPIKVTVGSGGLVYSPSEISAPVGSTIEFSFFPRNHTVTQSSFKDPCHPLAGGFSSFFVPTTASPSDTTYTITVTDTKPIWIYCSQGNHCQQGMVMAINAPATGNTFAGYVALAKAATKSTEQPAAVGGILAVGSNSAAPSAAPTAAPTAGSVSTYVSSSRTFTTTFGLASVQTGASPSATGAGAGSGSGSATTAGVVTATGNAAVKVGGSSNAVAAMLVAAVGMAAVL